MKTVVLGMLAETSIHPGMGRSGGVVDLPVSREAATDYPFIAGSSLKGALRAKAQALSATAGDDDVEPARPRVGESDVREWFGVQDAAGRLIISDARLLLLPVRSLTGSYRWLTCPHILERFLRDISRSGLVQPFDVPRVERSTLHASGSGHIYLEERDLAIACQVDEKVANAIGRLISHKTTRERVPEMLAITHDSDFAWFARYALCIQARNYLDSDTKQSKNLWYEESLPSDTVFYTLLSGRSLSATGVRDALFGEDPYLQVGGNETTGEGWLSVRQLDLKTEAA